jgi:hypothetical protein
MPNETPEGLYRGGPCVVFGRGHCGGRILSEAYFRNDIYMGRLSKKNRDTHGMGLKNPWMIEVAKGAYGYLGSAPDERARLERLLGERVEELRKKAAGKPYGWKVGSSIHCIEILLGTHADARVVHLIRDGRDVCLSRLDARLRAKHIVLPENKISVFGHSDITSWKGVALERAVEDDLLRNELEMLHWKTATEFGLRGRAYPGQYKEVRYEELCRSPVETLETVFDFIGVSMKPEVRQWAAENIHAARIGKWKGRETELTGTFELGEPTLAELGYV